MRKAVLLIVVLSGAVLAEENGSAGCAVIVDPDQAICLAKAGQWAAAEIKLRSFVARKPESEAAWFWLAQSQLYQKQYDEALVSVGRAITLNPKSSEVYRTLGQIQLERKHNQEAYEAWIQANQLNPKDSHTTYYLGRLFLEADFHNEAAAWFRETLKLAPKDFAAMTYLGICAERLDFHDTALQLYRAAIQESKEQGKPFAWAYLSLAKLLRAGGDEAGALMLLEEGARLCPEGHLLTQLANMLEGTQPARAEQALRNAIALDPSISETHYHLAMLLRKTGKAEEAAKEMAEFQRTKQEEDRNKGSVLAVRKKNL